MDILDIFLDILLKPPQPLMDLFFLPVALERGQVGGGCWGHLGVWGCLHMHTHMYTCIEIANGHQHVGIHF